MMQPMTHIGEALTSAIPRPAPSKLELWLVKRFPATHSLDPMPLRYACPTCGEQEPRPYGGIYVRRECECAYLARLDRAHAIYVQDQQRVLAQRRLHAAYAWLDQYNSAIVADHRRLGHPVGMDRLEQCTFAGWNMSRFPVAYTSATVLADHVVQKRTWIKNLMMVGGPGTGKTHLLAAIIAVITKHGLSARFCTAKMLFDTLYAVSFADKAEILRELGTCPLWGLDELDKLPIGERGGDFQKNTLQDILNARSRRHLPTVFTANERNDFSKWLDASALSRLFEGGRMEVMVGEDYRLLQGAGVSLWPETGQ